MRPNSPDSPTVGMASSSLRSVCPAARATASTRPSRIERRRALVQAYILIQTEVGKAAEVAAQLGKLAGVTHSEDITGPYDVIVRAEARDMDQLTSLVTAQMHPIPGLTRTITCPVVHL